MNASRIAAPRVYGAISAIMAELAVTGIARTRRNEEEGYAYRGIDDVMATLAPLLARHKLCVLPRVLERSVLERQGGKDGLLVSVSLRVAFDLVSARDGSTHVIEAWGEALDGSDKASAKAMSAAWKHAMLQAFCIPVPDIEDTDARSPRLGVTPLQADPVQGWKQWSADISEMIGGCQTPEAIARVQETYRDLLRAISKRQPELYIAIGTAISERKQALAHAALPACQSGPKGDGQAGQGPRRVQAHSRRSEPAPAVGAREQASA